MHSNALLRPDRIPRDPHHGDDQRDGDRRGGDQRHDEEGRHCALVRYDILDSEPEPEFERIVDVVKVVFDVPIAAVSLIDRERQWFKAIRGIDVRQTPRSVAFCDHTIRHRTVLSVPDTHADPRFCTNPLVTGAPFIRSYLGAPLTTPDGYNAGAVCVIDRRIRHYAEKQHEVLERFAALVVEELELRQIASSDALTGMQTRRAFLESLERFAREAPPVDATASLVVFDLDHFKRINDTFGHPAGDAVLKSVAATVQEMCGPEVMLGRIGGEEFAALLLARSGRSAVAFAEALRGAVEAAVAPDWPEIAFTASFGVADFQRSATTIAQWASAADEALYRAKKGGRNRVAN